ncbi:MAG: Spy/CpxP family protein refolding chaperone [Bradyrhizobiaceae bacterium]|nr:Spy/CpxP family protein refolding chaperone [Bradyrhizobiaceae bacterium]
MKKALLIAAAAVFLAGGSAVAYKAYAHGDGWRHGRWHQMNADDMSAFADARIAALKAGLKLSAEQEKLWPPVEAALNDLAKKRIDRREQFRAERRDRQDVPNPIERMRRGADFMSETGTDLKRLADAADPLYQSLDDAQKRRFDALAQRGMHGMRGKHHEDRGWRRHGDLGDEGRHPGMGPGQMGPRHGMGPGHMGPGMGPRGDDERGPGWRQRTNFQYGVPAGAERL